LKELVEYDTHPPPGASDETIRGCFEEAYRTTPSIILIDEIDAITSKRENVQRSLTKLCNLLPMRYQSSLTELWRLVNQTKNHLAQNNTKMKRRQPSQAKRYTAQLMING
ncbi:uncharacterized protein A4U43_C07F18160, partial [Asparagus officinalis]